jgi:hypothetical protein
MIDWRTAAELLDFGARIDSPQRAEEQLKGAVAIHNLLCKQRVAYLADEVGMGKTYVALGALALFRHFQPDFRVLIIAPRENIQTKWIKEYRNFIRHNVRFPDLRVKALDGGPARPLVGCHNLLEFLHEVTLASDRDFFLRLTSFSLPLAGRAEVDREAARRLREGICKALPWLRDEIFDLRNKQTFKDNFARALCCALPTFDLVIIDEGHNLKHGFGEYVSARNRILGLALGHPDSTANSKWFPRSGCRAWRVLFLSATPVEETYDHLWNQLNVFGLSQPFDALRQPEIEEEQKKAVAGEFLIRRVTSVRVAGEEYTKNLYRREWRQGGVQVHDEPIRVQGIQQRLIVALVQKKVSELLGHEQFKASFQIGMLASFESFLETTRLKRDDGDEGNFDDTEQTNDCNDILEREGIDVSDVNRLAQSYRQTFGQELPHPKMDAVRDQLARAWTRGEKTLVFVRRVASVKELKRKLDERYDDWLRQRLFRELPESLHPRLAELFERYQGEKFAAIEKGAATRNEGEGGRAEDEDDKGGNDTFFAWFFRGEGPRGVVGGATIQQRFIQRGAIYSTFFEDNDVADVLGCRPGEVEETLAQCLHVSRQVLRSGLQERSRRFLSRAQKHARADRFSAVQAAAIEWLKDSDCPHRELAAVVWRERHATSVRRLPALQAPEIGDWLELRTFFTELRLRPALRDRLWPRPTHQNRRERVREQALRMQLLASAARLGHGMIELYTMTVRRLGSLDPRTQDTAEDDSANTADDAITDYLVLLERQMNTPVADRDWGTFDELSNIAAHFDLILDVNEPEARTEDIATTARLFGRLLGRQKPVGGMSGQVNQTLVRQFRMPGYPLILVTTDLLQEGEDLHTFCSSVQHYGISWTPSSMEQRIGRIDRVRSQTDRRLSALAGGTLQGEDKLQVYFPHLQDTVEVLQVERVLERMNVFVRLMHEGLTTAGAEEKRINMNEEFARGRRAVPQILERLQSAFPVRTEHIEGGGQCLAVSHESACELGVRFAALAEKSPAGVDVNWHPQPAPGILLGTARLGGRVQPFTVFLRSLGPMPMVRCISPVGRVDPIEVQDSAFASRIPTGGIRIGAIVTNDERTYDLTAEGDVLLTARSEDDSVRVGILISRVVAAADALEQEFLPGQDETLDTFHHDLVKEANHGR